MVIAEDNPLGVKKIVSRLFAIAVIIFVLILSYLYSFLLFHTLSELLSVIIAFAIFVIAWNSREFLKSEFFLFLGISYFFVAGVDFVHTISYKGLNVFVEFDANLPTQLWIIGRYLQSISLLLAVLFINRRLSPYILVYIYMFVTVFLLITAFTGIFPDSFIEGSGLTPFKKVSEYIISLTFLVSMGLLWRKRSQFDQAYILYDVFAAVIFAIFSELVFTSYIDVYDLNNVLGHIFKVLSVYFAYNAFVASALSRPYSLLFRELKQNESALKEYQDHLEAIVANRTASLNQEINTRREVEVKLRHSQSRLASFADALPDAAFVINREGICVEIITSSSYESDEHSDTVLGQSIYTRLPDEYIGLAKDTIQQVFSSQELRSMEYEKNIGGNKRWVEKRVAPVATTAGEEELVICVERDITEARQENFLLQLRLSLSEYAATHTVDELMQRTVDEAELLTESTIAFLHLLESDEQTLSLQIWSSNTLAKLDNQMGDEHHMDVTQAGVWADCIRQRTPIIHNNYLNLPHRKGMPETHIPLIREILIPIIRANNVVAVLGVANKAVDYQDADRDILFWVANMAWDIIARKKAELRANQSEETIILKDKFISTVSHEFRTPLAIIQTSIDLVTRYGDRLSKERHQQAFQRIAEQVKSLTGLINDVLSINRTQTKRMEFNPAPVVLNQFCRTLFEQIQFADSSDHEFEFSTSLSDKMVNIDANLLQHIVTNLLSNAIKYTPEGRLVSLNLYQEGQDIVIAISDEGIGIPEEEQVYLFEPFYRASNVGDTHGTGLGLSIIKEYVLLHGGRINFTSVPDQGSTFCVFLPATSEKVTFGK